MARPQGMEGGYRCLEEPIEQEVRKETWGGDVIVVRTETARWR